MINSFEEMLLKIRDYKDNYRSDAVKLSAPALFTMVMAGAFDSLCKEPPTIEDRHLMIDKVRIALRSKASLDSAKNGGMPISEITNELDRRFWLAKINPIYTFSISEHYSQAMDVMGYIQTGKPNLKFRKNNEDIFSNFKGMFAPQCIQFYGNRNVTRKPGIVALYTGYQTLTYSRGKFIKVSLSDGTDEMEGVIWPTYGTSDHFDPALVNALRTYRKKVCLVMAKISRNNRGFNSLTIQEMRLIS